MLPAKAFAFPLQLSDKASAESWHSWRMKTKHLCGLVHRGPVILLASALLALAAHAETNNIPNRLIDYDTFLAHAADVGRLRAQRRVTEQQFLELAAQPETIIFDARSDDKYERLHIRGARHLSFSEITEPELAKIFPAKSTCILIYCNNNFLNVPDTFATKAPSPSLNIHTFNTLVSYGYTNVYELGPLLDVRKTRISFDGTQAKSF
jgi:hypothetical protein